MKEIKIGNNAAGKRLDSFLKGYLPGAGSGFIYKMLRKKNITLNGKKPMEQRNSEKTILLRSFFLMKHSRNSKEILTLLRVLRILKKR